jgi:hypothetical protein
MTTPAEQLAIRTKQSELNSFFIDKMGLISVKSYGAKGDGVTDDTAAITAAKNAADAAGAKSLYFPRGVYKVNSGLNLSGFFLWGDNSSFDGISDTIAQVADFASGADFNALKAESVYLQADDPPDTNSKTLWFEVVGEGDINFSQGGVAIENAETSAAPPETFYWFEPIL